MKLLSPLLPAAAIALLYTTLAIAEHVGADAGLCGHLGRPNGPVPARAGLTGRPHDHQAEPLRPARDALHLPIGAPARLGLGHQGAMPGRGR